MSHRPFLFLLSLALLAFLSGCAGPEPYRYKYIPGKTAVLRDGYAIAPASAPAAVHQAIAAGNRISGLPYAYGGGHGRGFANAYDCSGATSFVLQAAGRLRSPTTSRGFRQYGSSGEGKWISIYARKDHTFLVIAGLRFDTGWTGAPRGPRWTTKGRPTKGSVVRHPPGL
ncbi:MAG: peptidoglycan endopeptidase [Burkholderiales bacterium]|nr:MAG: peptidoglycan endopeptidase [Burkholderiales bacterium]